jgi:hypothetical protein
MDFARIRRESGPIRSTEWDQLIESQSYLRPVSDRQGVNPFTSEQVIFPGIGKANYVIDGETIGNASLENGTVLTAGVSRQHCEEIARHLGAIVEADDRS